MKFITHYNLFEKEEYVNSTILFTDIVGSSVLWKNDPEKMIDELKKHHELISNIFSEFNLDAMIVKTIGDAFMIIFNGKDSLRDAIIFAINLLSREEKFKIRIGIAKGEIIETEFEIQNKKLKDYLGNTVNTASRMESKISPENGFAFTILDNIDKKESIEILNILKENWNIERIRFSKNCDKKEFIPRKRSNRLLTDLQISKCENIENLKGVDECDVWKICKK